jgi:uncharacterized protein (TIGR04255 family)
MNRRSEEEISLPDFENPPVVEVAASVQFGAIQGLDAARLGTLWLRFRDKYPKPEQHPALPRVVESFGAPRTLHFGFSVLASQPTPRLWFLNEDGTRLVQVQSDRLIINWRQLDTGTAYPRYPILRTELIAAVEVFDGFLSDEKLQRPVIDQAELTYVNHFDAGQPGTMRTPLSAFLRFWQEPRGVFLSDSPEEAAVRTQYIMRVGESPVGRLFVELESAYSAKDNAPIYVLNLAARGAPSDPTLDGALSFLDLAHLWIVQSFADITTPNMHNRWERKR